MRFALNVELIKKNYKFKLNCDCENNLQLISIKINIFNLN